MGAVARAVVNKLGLKSDFEFGISHSAAIAASRGLNVFVLVVGRMVNRMISEVDSQNMRFGGDIMYEVKDAQLSSYVFERKFLINNPFTTRLFEMVIRIFGF